MKRYVIRIDGYGEEEFIAETASKARWQAWKLFSEAQGPSWPGRFIDFARAAYTLHLGNVA